jgi:hypothetical protein
MRTEFVDSYRQLRLRIRELARKHPGERLVFRGQVAFYKGAVVPSIMRHGQAAYHEEQHPFWYTLVTDMVLSMAVEYQTWLQRRGAQGKKPSAATEPSEEPTTPASLGSHIERLLQHYGARSNYVDVTSSLPVALWFAHHAHNMHDLPLMPGDVPDVDPPLDPYGQMRVFDIAWYERAWPEKKTGYLFILAPNIPRNRSSLRHGDYIDLNPNVMATRISRQRAGLIFAEQGVDAGDLRKFVLRVFRFALPLKGVPRFVKEAETNVLFPTPDEDVTYAKLLARIPFQTDLNAPFSVRRIVRIPEYYDAFLSQGSPAWKAFRRQDIDRGITLFFAMLITQDHSTVVCRAGDADIYLKDATPILCPRSISFIMDISSVDEFTLAPHGNNLFFEYDPIHIGVAEDTSIIPSDPRGVWLVAHGNQIWCRLFAKSSDTDSDLRVSATFGHWFTFENEKLTLVGEAPKSGDFHDELIEAERQLLGIVLSLVGTCGMTAES